MSIVINMPQMAANGLSENWLFKHCGDQHWQALCDSLEVQSGDLCDDTGARLYPTFVAIFGRYTKPLSAVRENERFETRLELAHFGSSFFHSRVELFNDNATFALEMLTTFVARDEEGRNELHRSTPRSDLRSGAASLESPPEILTRSQAMRHGEIEAYSFHGRSLRLGGATTGLSREYEPSPYVDYNGANLLYFAAYPTICDTLERQIVRSASLVEPGPDWALATSTVARDVYYYGNLDLGASLRATLNRFDRDGESVVLHTTLSRVGDRHRIADLFTERQIVT